MVTKDGNKYLIFGTGSRAKRSLEFLEKFNHRNEIEIVAFVDNNSEKWGKNFEGYPIISPGEIKSVDWDYISVWSTFYDEIVEELVNRYSIPKGQIKNAFVFFLDKCKFTREETELSDVEIQSQRQFIETIIERVSENNPLTVWGFEPKNESHLYEAHYDENAGLYYTMFESKRLYFSRTSVFRDINGKKYAPDIWYEQDDNSPHRYEKDEICVKEGDVLLDVGACEGNFSLYNIEKVKKLYLFESNPEWVEALEYTFAPWKDKVVIVPKFVSNEDNDEMVSIDAIVKENKSIFFKVDVEGAERKVLAGARKLITSAEDLRCAVCAYHRHGDEDAIRNFLEENGVTTSMSDGYMFFYHDPYMYEQPELRKGLVRGKKFC